MGRLETVEEATRICMLERGFDYQPQLPSLNPSFGVDLAPGFVPSPTSDRGYGLALAHLDIPDQAFRDYGTAQWEASADVRPSSGAEWIAYDEALNGVDGQSGCAERGRKSNAEAIALADEFHTQIWQIRARIAADPRTLDLDEKWAACMASKGFGQYKHVTEPPGVLSHRVDAVINELFKPFDEESMVDRRNRLEAILDEEVQVAKSDLSCRAEPDQADRLNIESEYFRRAGAGLVETFVPDFGT